jgi:hypothetical protein
VEKALERDATNRYTKIREFESQLEEIFKGGLVISPSPLQPPTPTPPTPTPTPLPTPAHPEPPPLEVIREFLQQAIAINGYLDKETERKVLSEATQRGVLADDARFLIEAELETSGAVSERLLLEELERQLHIKTDRDKVLDKKEYDDIIGIVTKAKPGKKRGLKLDVAQKHIQDFCITHGVKVKLKKKRFGIF